MMLMVGMILSLMSTVNAEVCTEPFQTYQLQKGESLYSVARDNFGDYTTYDGAEYRSWKVLLARNYHYINRCFDRKTCQQVQFTDEKLQQLFPDNLVDPHPLSSSQLKNKCVAFNKEEYISRYICSLNEGDILYLAGSGPQTRAQRDIVVKDIARNPTKRHNVTIYERESLYDIVRRAYEGFSYTDEQLKAYTMSLGTRNEIKEPFLGVPEAKCLEGFLPMESFYSASQATNPTEDRVVDLSNMSSVESSGITITIVGRK